MKRRDRERRARRADPPLPRSIKSGPLRFLEAQIGGYEAHLYVVPELVAHTLSDMQRVISLITLARVAGVEVAELERDGEVFEVRPIRWLDEDGRTLTGWTTTDVCRAIVNNSVPRPPAVEALHREVRKLCDEAPCVFVQGDPPTATGGRI